MQRSTGLLQSDWKVVARNPCHVDIPNLKTIKLHRSFERVKSKTISSMCLWRIFIYRCFLDSLQSNQLNLVQLEIWIVFGEGILNVFTSFVRSNPFT